MSRRTTAWTPAAGSRRSPALALVLLVLLMAPACHDDDRIDPSRRATAPELWERAREAGNIEAYEAYYANYPQDEHAHDAKVILRELWDLRVKELSAEQLAKAVAVIDTSEGVMKFAFYVPEAPNTVRNFIKLAKSHFYDGLSFHRVVKNFLIQGGDPLGTGLGGPGYTIPAELNGRPHVEGSVGMARIENELNSAGSQFYICLGPQPNLDEKWTVFGQVIEGKDVLQKIGAVPVDDNYKPLTPVVIKSITIEGL